MADIKEPFCYFVSTTSNSNWRCRGNWRCHGTTELYI